MMATILTADINLSGMMQLIKEREVGTPGSFTNLIADTVTEDYGYGIGDPQGLALASYYLERSPSTIDDSVRGGIRWL